MYKKKIGTDGKWRRESWQRRSLLRPYGCYSRKASVCNFTSIFLPLFWTGGHLMLEITQAFLSRLSNSIHISVSWLDSIHEKFWSRVIRTLKTSQELLFVIQSVLWGLIGIGLPIMPLLSYEPIWRALPASQIGIYVQFESGNHANMRTRLALRIVIVTNEDHEFLDFLLSLLAFFPICFQIFLDFFL